MNAELSNHYEKNLNEQLGKASTSSVASGRPDHGVKPRKGGKRGGKANNANLPTFSSNALPRAGHMVDSFSPEGGNVFGSGAASLVEISTYDLADGDEGWPRAGYPAVPGAVASLAKNNTKVDANFSQVSLAFQDPTQGPQDDSSKQGQEDGKRGRRNHRPNHRFKGRHVRLNAKICQVSDRGDVWELLDLAEAHQVEMNWVNLSTILHRVARLAKKGQAIHTVAQHPQLLTIKRKIEAELASQEAQLLCPHSSQVANVDVESMPRCWSTIAWSFATLQIRDVKLFHQIAHLSKQQSDIFKTFEIANLLWAFAKMRIPAESCQQLLEVIAQQIGARLESFSPVSLSTIAWSYVSLLSKPPAQLLKSLSMAFVQQIGNASPQEIANMAWALATAKVIKLATFQEIGNAAAAQLPLFNIQELANTGWAFSRAGIRHAGLFHAYANLFQNSPRLASSFHAQGLANLMWALAKQVTLGAQFQEVTTVIMHILCACKGALEEMKPQELSSVLWSCAKVGLKMGYVQEADDLFSSVARLSCDQLSGFSIQGITNVLYAFTEFLEFDESGDYAGLLGLLTRLVLERLQKFEPIGLLYVFETTQILLDRAIRAETKDTNAMVNGRRKTEIAHYRRLEEATCNEAVKHMHLFSEAGLSRLAVVATKLDAGPRAILSTHVAWQVLSRGLDSFRWHELTKFIELSGSNDKPHDLNDLHERLAQLARAIGPVPVSSLAPNPALLEKLRQEAAQSSAGGGCNNGSLNDENASSAKAATQAATCAAWAAAAAGRKVATAAEWLHNEGPHSAPTEIAAAGRSTRLNAPQRYEDLDPMDDTDALFDPMDDEPRPTILRHRAPVTSIGNETKRANSRGDFLIDRAEVGGNRQQLREQFDPHAQRKRQGNLQGRQQLNTQFQRQPQQLPGRGAQQSSDVPISNRHQPHNLQLQPQMLQQQPQRQQRQQPRRQQQQQQQQQLQQPQQPQRQQQMQDQLRHHIELQDQLPQQQQLQQMQEQLRQQQLLLEHQQQQLAQQQQHWENFQQIQIQQLQLQHLQTSKQRDMPQGRSDNLAGFGMDMAAAGPRLNQGARQKPDREQEQLHHQHETNGAQQSALTTHERNRLHLLPDRSHDRRFFGAEHMSGVNFDYDDNDDISDRETHSQTIFHSDIWGGDDGEGRTTLDERSTFNSMMGKHGQHHREEDYDPFDDFSDGKEPIRINTRTFDDDYDILPTSLPGHLTSASTGPCQSIMKDATSEQWQQQQHLMISPEDLQKSGLFDRGGELAHKQQPKNEDLNDPDNEQDRASMLNMFWQMQQSRHRQDDEYDSDADAPLDEGEPDRFRGWGSETRIQTIEYIGGQMSYPLESYPSVLPRSFEEEVQRHQEGASNQQHLATEESATPMRIAMPNQPQHVTLAHLQASMPMQTEHGALHQGMSGDSRRSASDAKKEIAPEMANNSDLSGGQQQPPGVWVVNENSGPSQELAATSAGESAKAHNSQLRRGQMDPYFQPRRKTDSMHSAHVPNSGANAHVAQPTAAGGAFNPGGSNQRLMAAAASVVAMRQHEQPQADEQESMTLQGQDQQNAGNMNVLMNRPRVGPHGYGKTRR